MKIGRLSSETVPEFVGWFSAVRNGQGLIRYDRDNSLNIFNGFKTWMMVLILFGHVILYKSTHPNLYAMRFEEVTRARALFNRPFSFFTFTPVTVVQIRAGRATHVHELRGPVFLHQRIPDVRDDQAQVRETGRRLDANTADRGLQIPKVRARISATFVRTKDRRRCKNTKRSRTIIDRRDVFATGSVFRR